MFISDYKEKLGIMTTSYADRIKEEDWFRLNSDIRAIAAKTGNTGRISKDSIVCVDHFVLKDDTLYAAVTDIDIYCPGKEGFYNRFYHYDYCNQFNVSVDELLDCSKRADDIKAKCDNAEEKVSLLFGCGSELSNSRDRSICITWLIAIAVIICSIAIGIRGLYPLLQKHEYCSNDASAIATLIVLVGAGVILFVRHLAEDKIYDVCADRRDAKLNKTLNEEYEKLKAYL